MRISVTTPALAFGVLLAFNSADAQAGRFFGSANNGAEPEYQYPRSPNSFNFGPGSYYQAQQRPPRHRLFHRNQGGAKDAMPAGAMQGYGMQAGVPPSYGMPANTMQGVGMAPMNVAPFQYMQAPMVQPPFVQSQMLTPPVHLTTAPPAPVAPAMQSRLVPIPASMQTVPTTAEPPLVNPR